MQRLHVKEVCFTVTLKDYAKELGVTYEAVRKQMKRYSAELEGHIHQQGRTQYLDDEAVAFLDQHHAPKPIAIYEAGQDREMREMAATIEQLRSEKEDLCDRLARMGEKISELAEWKAEKALALADATQTKILLEAATADADKLRSELQEAQRRAAELDRDNRELKERGLLARILRKGE